MNSLHTLLQEKKLKKTPLRLVLLDVFASATTPLSISEIEEKGQEKNIFPNQTSLYRQMETLTAAGIIEEVQTTSGKSFYEIKKHHHHHFFCEQCQHIECLHDEAFEQAISLLEKKMKTSGKKISGHHFSLKGICQNCSL